MEKREAQREAERHEADLVAQRSVAVWTETMGVAAIIGMMVGLVGLGLILATFQATKRQVNIAERALKIQTRPFIYLEDIEWEETSIEDTEETHFDLTVLLKNVGLLPATNLRIWVSAHPVKQGDIATFAHDFADEPLVVPVCPPGVTRRVYYGLTLSAEDTERFNILKLGIAFGMRAQFDTRFVRDKTIEETRWGDSYIMRQKNRLYHNPPDYLRWLKREDDMFDEEQGGEDETNHEPSLD